MDFDWKAIVRTVAPGIASAFGTPLAGMAVTALLNAVLPADATKPADPEAFLAQTLASANPEMLLKMKQADQQFLLDMKKLDIDLEKFNEEDRASARQREIAVKDKTPTLLAFAIVGGFLAMTCGIIVTALLEYKIDPVSMGLIGTLVGYLSAKSELVLTYYYGSSSGSAEKSATIAKALAKA